MEWRVTTETVSDLVASAGDEQATFTAAMTRRLAGIDGTVGVMVHDHTGDRTLTFNYDVVFPTASTLKVPILYEIYRQADAGTIDLDRRVTLRPQDRVPGSGVLQTMDIGLQPTVRDLAELMITISDNEATDLLYGMIGREQIATTLRDVGMNQTHLPLTIRQMLSSIAGLDSEDPGTTYEVLRERLRTGPWDREGIGYAADERNDVSTPRDMVRLLDLIHAGTDIPQTSRTAMIQTLRNQNFNTIIPARLPDEPEIRVAHKTGSLRGVRNDVGIVETPQRTYTIAIMSKDLTDPAEAINQFAHLSRWIWDFLNGDVSE